MDNILIDEARTPLIISGPASDDTEWYLRMSQVVRQLNPEDYEISERDRTVSLTEIGEAHVEEILDIPLRDPERPEDITPEQARLMGYLEQALAGAIPLPAQQGIPGAGWQGRSSWMSSPVA